MKNLSKVTTKLAVLSVAFLSLHTLPARAECQGGPEINGFVINSLHVSGFECPQSRETCYYDIEGEVEGGTDEHYGKPINYPIPPEFASISVKALAPAGTNYRLTVLSSPNIAILQGKQRLYARVKVENLTEGNTCVGFFLRMKNECDTSSNRAYIEQGNCPFSLRSSE